MDKQELDLAIRELIADIQNTRALCRQWGEKTSLPASRWKEEQSLPTPIRRRQLFYSCKLPWEPDHRCRGKGKRHIIEMHYDNEDEEVHGDATIDSYLEQFEEISDSCALVEASDSCTLGEDSDPCTLEGQSDGQDDSTCALAVISHSVDDLTLQQSGDTSEDSHVLAPRHDELPMVIVTQLAPSQTPMIAMAHEDISGIADIVVEPCVRIAHPGQVDLHERHDLETMDFTHTYQYEESESPLLGTPLFDQTVETNSLMGHLLPGPVCSDEDALLIGRDDHSTCLDTSVWDPGANDSSRVSAQEDTTAHTGYSVIQMELAVGDGV
jgi:hypothetical protein